MEAAQVHQILAEGGIDGIDHVLRRDEESYTAVFWIEIGAMYLFIEQLAIEDVIDKYLLFYRPDFVPMIIDVEHGQMVEKEPDVILVEVLAHFYLYSMDSAITRV